MRQAGIVAAAGRLRARAQRRAARRRPRPCPAARRGLGRARASRSSSTRSRRTSSRSMSARSGSPRRRRSQGWPRRASASAARSAGRPARRDASRRRRRRHRAGDRARPARPRCPCPRLTSSTRGSSRSLRRRQAERLPSLAAAVVRGGETVWSDAVGLADLEAGIEATPETQYRVGSITKTFTAVAVMQLRDAGQARPRRPARAAPARASRTARRRSGGCSRTSPGSSARPGEMCVDGRGADDRGDARAMDGYELVLPAARAHHYSNLAYGAARRGRRPARRAARTRGTSTSRILEPLGLARTTWEEQEPRAAGYLVDEFAGTAAREPHTRHGRRRCDGPALVDGRRSRPLGRRSWPRAPTACSPRRRPTRCGRRRSMMNPDEWTVGWGLGLELVKPRRARSSAATAARCPASSPALRQPRDEDRRRRADELRHPRARRATSRSSSREATIELWPPEIEPWRPESAPPPEIARDPRPLVVGGERVRLLVEGRQARRRGCRARRRGSSRPSSSRSPRRLPRRRGPRAGRAAPGRGRRMVWAGYVFTRPRSRRRADASGRRRPRRRRRPAT